MLKKLIRQMLLTQILSAVTVTTCMLVNSMMIGSFLGINSMSAYGYGAPLILVFTAVSNMICTGSQVLCGRSLGIGDKDGANSCFTTAILSALIFSLIGTAIIFIFPDQICTLLGAGTDSPDNPVFSLTKDYLRGFSIGAAAFMIQQVTVPYMQMSGGRKRLIFSLCAVSAGNIVFGLLNIFVFKKGIFGMGLAYALSYSIAIIISSDFFIRKKMFLFRISLARIRLCFSLIKEGSPMLINQICLVLLPLVCNKLLTGYGGILAVAAYSVISSAGNICYSLGVGVNQVTLSLSSMFFADRDIKALRQCMKIILIHSLIINLGVDIVTLVITRPLVMLFIKDISALDMAIVGLRLLLLSVIPCGINSVMKNYYQGIGHPQLTTVISVLDNFVLKAACAVIFGFWGGVTGIWFCFAAGEVITLILICIYISIRSRRIRFSFDDFLLIPGYMVNDNESWDTSITSREEFTDISEKISGFCEDHGLNKKTSMYIALATEEIVANILTYGFTEKDSHIDIRVVISAENTVLRIRDNCRSFDPVRYTELHSDDDKISHIGIRMVMKLVKEAKYENSYGLNNLLLVF